METEIFQGIRMDKLDFKTLAIQYPALKSFVYMCLELNQPDQLIDLLFALEVTETFHGGN